MRQHFNFKNQSFANMDGDEIVIVIYIIIDIGDIHIIIHV